VAERNLAGVPHQQIEANREDDVQAGGNAHNSNEIVILEQDWEQDDRDREHIETGQPHRST